MTRLGHNAILKYLAISAATLAIIFWLATLGQPLIDQHEFRQTQTALTAYFLGPSPDGLLNYETPVLGSPWIVPFEFPLYQWLANVMARILPISLSASGRLLSVLFGLGCLWPALGIMRRFAIPLSGRLLFIVLDLTSSIYLYWNRSFMIESAALFWALISLFIYTILRDKGSHQSNHNPASTYGLHAAFLISLSLGLLVKATTSLPIFMLIGIDLITRSAVIAVNPIRLRREAWELLSIAASLLVAFLLLRTWTHHADALKQLNPIGQYITSKSLQPWNFGTLNQRLSADLWNGVLIQRMLTPWGTLPAAGLLLLGLLTPTDQQQQKTLILASLFLAISPLLIFTNLHIQHNYYQSANQIYLLLALASSTSLVLESNRRRAFKIVTSGLASLFILASLVAFLTSSRYYNDAFTTENVKLEIGSLIQSRTPTDAVLLIFDDDWSSAFGFHAKRKSLAVPAWFKDVETRRAFLSGDTQWLGGHPLAGVISKQPLSQDEQTALKARCGESKTWTFSDWNVYLCQANDTPTSKTGQG